MGKSVVHSKGVLTWESLITAVVSNQDHGYLEGEAMFIDWLDFLKKIFREQSDCKGVSNKLFFDCREF